MMILFIQVIFFIIEFYLIIIFFTRVGYLSMSFEEIKKRPRATSAKVSKQKIRPSSGNSQKNHHISDYIENIPGIVSIKKSNRGLGSRVGYFGDEIQTNKFLNNKIYKEKEQLLQQTIKLKRQINNLKNELNTQKSKTEQLRKKNSDYTKQLNVEFQKEIYWTGSNANMVRGVKSQYEQLKLKYEEKCQQFDQMTKELIYTQSKEEKTYIQMLQKQNSKLLRRLYEAQDQLRLMNHGTLTSKVQQDMDSFKEYKYQVHQQNEDLKDKLEQTETRSLIKSQKIKQLEKKIQYMDKLLIERDNNQHSSHKKYKKALIQRQIISKEADHLKEQKQYIVDKYQKKLKQIKQTLETQSETQRLIFKKQLTQKIQRVQKLQKEIAYLTTLLSYWKPIDQINHMLSHKINNSTLNINLIKEEDQGEMILEYSMGSTLIKNNLSKNMTKSIVNNSHPDEQMDAKSLIARSRRGSLEYRQHMELGMTNSIDLGRHDKSKMVQVTADKRNSEQGVKCRKVSYSEVAEICQTLKYRFIGQNMSIEEVKKFLDYNLQAQVLDSPEEEEWNKQYINMKQVKQLLKSQKFNLDEEDSTLLSRYLVEDSANDYVYCDPNNENLRSVVKSIIKTAIGQYDLIKNQRQTIEGANELIAKYESNLKSALNSIASNGIISKKKLLQLIKGLGIEITSQIESYLVAKLVLKSQNLKLLKYNMLFKS